MKPFDLHIHSNMSDGTFAPEELPALALKRGVSRMALTDHDTAAGCVRAIKAGRELGVQVIPGMEIDAEYSSELHILALNIDPDNENIRKYELWRGEARVDRNRRILKKLKAMGMDVEHMMEHSMGNDTRLHIAKALVTGGYAATTAEAFHRYLGSGCPAYEPSERISRKGAVELAMDAGGVAVLAHPCQLKGDPHGLIKELADDGLWGIEAYYSTSSPGQKRLFLSMAEVHGLVPTCGSDFHGKNRDVSIGDGYEEAEGLGRAYGKFFEE